MTSRLAPNLPASQSVKVSEQIDINSWASVQKNLTLIKDCLTKRLLSSQDRKTLEYTQSMLRESLVGLTLAEFQKQISNAKCPAEILQSFKHIDNGKTRETIGALLVQRAGELLGESTKDTEPKWKLDNALTFLRAAIERADRDTSTKLLKTIIDTECLSISKHSDLSNELKRKKLFNAAAKLQQQYYSRFKNLSSNESDSLHYVDYKTRYQINLISGDAKQIASSALYLATQTAGFTEDLLTFPLQQTIGTGLSINTANTWTEPALKGTFYLANTCRKFTEKVLQKKPAEQAQIANYLKVSIISHLMVDDHNATDEKHSADCRAIGSLQLLTEMEAGIRRSGKTAGGDVAEALNFSKDLVKRYINDTRDGSLLGFLKVTLREIQRSEMDEVASWIGFGAVVGATSGALTSLKSPLKSPVATLAFTGTGALAGASSASFALAMKNFVTGLPKILETASSQKTGDISWAETSFNLTATLLDGLSGPLALLKVRALHPELLVSNLKSSSLKEFKSFFEGTLGITIGATGEKELRSELTKILQRQLQQATKELVEFGGKSITLTGAALFIAGLGAGLQDIFARPLNAEQRDKAISAFIKDLGKMGLLIAAQTILHAGAAKLQKLDVPGANSLADTKPLPVLNVLSTEALPTLVEGKLQKVAGLSLAPSGAEINKPLNRLQETRHAINWHQQESQLKAKEQYKVIEFTKRWIDHALEDGISPDRLHQVSPLNDSLHLPLVNILGETKQWNNNLYPAKYRESLAYFTNALIDRINLLERGGKLDEAYKLSSQIKNLGCSGDPSIFSGLTILDKLVFGSKATRSPIIQSTFGPTFIDNLVYNLSVGAIEVLADKLSARFAQLSAPEKIDLVNTMSMIGATAEAWGYSSRAGTPKGIYKILQSLSEIENSPIVKSAIDLALGRLAQEASRPSVGIIQFSGDPKNARLKERTSKELGIESERIRRGFAIKLPAETVSNFSQIAPGYIAALDHSGTPQYLATTTVQPFETKPASIDILEVNRILNNRDYFFNPNSLKQVESTISYVEKYNLYDRVPEALRNKIDEYKASTETLSRITRQLDLEGREIEQFSDNLFKEWQKRFEEALLQLREDPAWRENQSALDGFIHEYFLAKSDNPTGDNVANDIAFIIILLKKPNGDKQLPSVDEPRIHSSLVAQLLADYDDFKTINASRYDLDLFSDPKRAERVRNLEKRWDLTQLREIHLRGANLREEAAPFNEPDALTRKLADGRFMVDRLFSFLEDCLKAESPGRPKLSFSPLQAALDNRSLNPFGKGQLADDALLLQRLHNPALKEKIETDLGITLSKIPLRSQIQFLRFMAEQAGDDFIRLASALKRHPDSATDIANAFLICAEDKAKGDTVLQLAETLSAKDAKVVFASYASLALEVEDPRQLIETNLQAPASLDPVKLTTKLLQRANSILEDTNKLLQSRSSPVYKDEVIQRLERARAEVLLTGTTVKELYAQGTLSLSSIKNTEVSVVTASEITPVDKRLLSDINRENALKLYEPEYAEAVQKSFEQALNDNSNTFYLLKIDGQVVSFLRSKPGENNSTLFLASFNTDDLAKRLDLGFRLFEQVLEITGKEHDLVALSHPETPALKRYIEYYGFEVVGNAPMGAGIRDALTIIRKRDAI